LIALWHRNGTEEGQHVDVSMQVAVIWTLMDATPFPPLHKENVERWGAYHKWKSILIRAVFPCKDGHVSATIWEKATMEAIMVWMEEEGVLPDLMKSHRGESDVDEFLSRGEDAKRELLEVEKYVCDFFATKTKAELYERAVSHRMMLAPCSTAQDVSVSIQLKARGFWLDLQHPELGDSLTHLGPYIKISDTPITVRRPAPRIGEHNEEIFTDELGLNRAQLQQLRSVNLPAPKERSRLGETKQSLLSSVVRGGSTETPMALEGIKVLDFTWIGVGPITIKYLADHGATVIHVESVTRPDGLRLSPPFKDAETGINRSQFAANFNTSKYGLGLNMAKPEAQDLIRRLIAKWQPDVIAETFTPKVMRSWGLDYASVRKLRLDIIYFSACQQGQTGPHARFAGYGMQAAALGGFYHITGWPDREPSVPYGAYADFINPPNGAAAIMAALDYRRRTGHGQYLDMAQFECAAQYLAPALMDFQLNGRVLNRKGNHDDSYAPHGVYPCKEGSNSLNGLEVARTGGYWCAIDVTSDEEWEALCKAIGDLPWTREGRFSTFAGRKENEDELDRLLGEWTAQHEARGLMERLQEAGVPAGVVQSQSDLWQDPQLKHQNYFQWLNHAECGPMPYDGLQFLMSKTPGKLRMPHALIGEHNELILKDFLGLSDDEINDLLVQEVLEAS
ncbi:MAG: CoA transferase, partial [Dehalococcoidia bacterium]